jgi:hypothetical protein
MKIEELLQLLAVLIRLIAIGLGGGGELNPLLVCPCANLI